MNSSLGNRLWGRLGWIFLFVGLALLVEKYIGFNFWWVLSVLGLLMIITAVRPKGEGSFVFPGTILIGMGATLLLRQYHLISFPIWKLWPLFFSFIGLGFILVWMLRSEGWWTLIPGGIMLLIGGAGTAFETFARYQIWLRKLVGYWPLLAVAVGIIILVSYTASRRHRANCRVESHD